MLRYLLVATVSILTGYVAGVLFGYRTAVRDYVENDARTIREMADSMYDTVEEDDLPEEVQEALERAQADDSDEGDDPSAFQ